MRGRRREPIEGLESVLGHTFRDPELLRQALSHRSWAHEHAGEGDYERLEFLGDALLGFLVSDRLYRASDASDEGWLTRRRQRFVNTEALAAAAERLGLGGALRLGYGEESSGGRAKSSLLADVFEAVLAAIYLDGGLRAARTFLRRHLAEPGGAPDGDVDYKTRFQELAQDRLRTTPRYRIVSTHGPSHAIEFLAEALVNDVVVGAGRGRSRKKAEQEAARAALERSGWSDDGDEAR